MSWNVKTTQAANELDLVDFLQTLGFFPKKTSKEDYWYCSPLRDERTPSFKVNRKLNAWYDHGTGKGGSVVDFGIEYYGCTVKEFLQRLRQDDTSISFHRTAKSSTNRKTVTSQERAPKITILSAERLTDPRLIDYVKGRAIPKGIADQFCQQVNYQIKAKRFVAIGFKNDQSGYELRSEYFKGSSSPKSPTLIKNGSEILAVFEGFFSFMSFQVLAGKTIPSLVEFQQLKQSDFLILNSLAFLEKSRQKNENYKEINLFLDNDKAGREAAVKTVAWSTKIRDRSELYKGHKDLNDYLVHLERLNQSQKKSRGLRL